MRKELFDDAMGELPASTVDVDAIMARGRRADRIRRMANPAVAAGAAVVLVTGGIALTLLPGDADGGVRVGAQQTSSASVPLPPFQVYEPGADDRPPACDRPDLETAAEVNIRLTAAAKAAIQARRPDVTLAANAAADPDGVYRGALEFFQFTSPPGADLPICDGHSQNFMSLAATHAPDGDGNISFAVAPGSFGSPPWACADESTGCVESTGPNGEFVKATTIPGAGGVIELRVDVAKPDGTMVMIIAANGEAAGLNGGAPTAAAPPLSQQQLVDIALDPGMTLFP